MSKSVYGAVVAACLLSACGGGGDGGGDSDGDGWESRSLSQDVGPSPYFSPSAAITLGPSTAEAAVAEVLAAYADVEVAARYWATPVPVDFNFSDLPAGRSTESCPDGGRASLRAPSHPQAGAQFQLDFSSCSIDGALLNGPMLIELTAYTNAFNNAFAIAADELSIRLGGQAFPPIPGLIACHRISALQCYFSLGGRGWSNVSMSDGDANGLYAAAWSGGGSVIVDYNAMDPVQGTGSATVTGLNGSRVVIQALSPGQYDVTITDTSGASANQLVNR